MYTDRIDLTFVAEDLTAAAAGLTAAEGALILPSLNPVDRKHLPKIGMKNEALALQIIEVGRANPDLIPRGIDFAKIDRDIAARAQVNPLLIQSRRYTARLEDTRLLLGVDIYVVALAIYHSLKRNARSADLRASVEELTRGFARVRQTEPEPEIPNGTIIVP
ncbi:MAG: hypothetical protein EOP83_32900 [Verrucomicrobiaceae bacterium]|nr:MAG: hypothetical protein EOP83_32900 [Verrucomicrobiaceae bacterium]